MADHVAVRHAELITHAGHVEAIADRVTTAASAGSAVRAGSDAYGTLCAMVPVMLNALQDVLVDGIHASAGSLHDTGARLRATAAEYQSTDRRRADGFRADGFRADGFRADGFRADGFRADGFRGIGGHM